MQVNKIFLGMLACVLMCACSSVESDVDDASKVFTGDEAYITVRLTDANAQTRATSNNPPEGYENGDSTEHKVTNAYFYFYDGNGTFVAEGSAWNGGSAEGGNTNVEFKSNTVVVLKGVTEKNFPKYMVTVLNKPTNFSPGSTLLEMEEKLSDEDGVGIYGGNGKFVMSTTSYNFDDATGGNKPTYFTTEVTPDNFSLEPIKHETNSDKYVEVFVERLAAKVTLKVGDDLKNGTTINGETYYKIQTTIAGQGNAPGDTIAAETLYVKFLGWKLNATAKRSNIVKNIGLDWGNQYPGFIWNNATDHRSFWGKSFNYGDGSYTYPLSYSTADEAAYALNYTNLDSDLVNMGSSSYCAENTNTGDIVSNNFPSAVTSILLKAQICNNQGEALNLVRFNGILYTESAFKAYILKVMDGKGMLENAYIQKDDITFIKIDTANVKIVDASNGNVKLQLKDVVKLYTKGGDEGAKVTDINTQFGNECDGANAFNGGLMYYNIPIEHLNNPTDNSSIQEGQYGVVRNHHYYVTITKLEKLGRGIYDPEENIVPGNDDKETYYVGATIKILSWKLVNQSVEL